MALIASFLILLAACQPASSGPLLTDPREIVLAGVKSTAALQSVHARLDVGMQFRMQDVGAAQPMAMTAVLDADVDLGTRAIAAKVTAGGMGGNQVSEMILVDGKQFMRTPPATRWTTMPVFGPQVPLPTNQELAAAIAAALDGPGIVLHVADAQECGGATCYHVVAEVDPNVAWQLFGPALGGGNAVLPREMNLQPITLDILVDQASRALVGVGTTVAVEGSTTNLKLALSNHDVPVMIGPPPAALVDEFNFNDVGGDGQILTEVGNEATPAPAAVESP